MSGQLSIVNQLHQLQKPFGKQNQYGLSFETECLFAKQQIMKNDFTLKTAQNNSDSLRNAILNIAAVGISLNPASAHAYLVPRDGQICLDISYRGLVKLATDTGAIEWAKAVLVYEGDTFEWHGPTKEPVHTADVFADNRINSQNPLENLKGGYCIAKLTSGGYMVEIMTAGEIIAVRDSSKAQNGPWKGKWAGEMAKKTLVKRAYKSWPQSNGRGRLDGAINILNQHEGLLEEKPSLTEYLKHSQSQEKQFHEMLQGDVLDYYLWWRELDERIQISLSNSFKHGEKGKGADLMISMKNKGSELFTAMLLDLTTACESEDEVGAKEVLEDLTGSQTIALIDALNVELVLFAKGVIN